MAAKKVVESFTVRIYEGDEIALPTFDKLAEEHGATREEQVRKLMRSFLAGLEYENAFYTIKGYSDDHTRDADIVRASTDVYLHKSGFDSDEDSTSWRILEHAKDIVERNGKGDRERAVALFERVFGVGNVFLKKGEW